MTTILTIAGSLRKQSVNRRLLTTSRRESLTRDVRWAGWDELAALPAFDQDLEDEPTPGPVIRLRTAISGADALLISTPEYNGSIPGALKNAVDWASRPHGAGVLIGKPVAVIGASPSPHGAAWATAELRKSLGVAGADVLETGLTLPHAPRQLDEHDRLVDAESRAGLVAVLEALLDRVSPVQVPAR